MDDILLQNALFEFKISHAGGKINMNIRKAFILVLIVLIVIVSSCSSLALEKESKSIEPITTTSENKDSDKYGGEVDASNEEDEPLNTPEQKDLEQGQPGAAVADSAQKEEEPSSNTFVSKNSTSVEETSNVKTPRSISIVVTVVFVVILGCAFCFLLYDKRVLFVVVGISCVLYLGYLVFGTDIFCRHAWVEAACENPKTCSKCGKTEGEALGHDVAVFKVIREATCQQDGSQSGTCNRCGKTIVETIPQEEHEPDGKLVIIQKATYKNNGKKAEHCLVCGQACNIKSYYLSNAEAEQDFCDSCNRYSYETLARYSESFTGQLVKVAGKVIQVIEGDDGVVLLVNITKDKYDYFDDTVIVNFTGTLSSRILEDDIIAVYGTMRGSMSYTALLGNSVTAPVIQARNLKRISSYSYDSI